MSKQKGGSKMPASIVKIQKVYVSFLDNKIAKLSKKYKMGIFAATILIPIIAFFFLFYSPKNKEIQALKKNNVFLKGEIQKVEAITDKLDEHKKESERVELQLKAASLLLPKQKEIPSLLTNISEQGTRSGLEFRSFTPRAERTEQFYAIIPVAITVAGSYHKIGTFLDKLSKLNRIVAVNNINLAGAKQSGNEMELTASLELVTYRFHSAEEIAAAANQKKKKKR